MSLNVSPELLDRARSDDVTDADLVECVRTSLPYAWSVVTDVTGRLGENGSTFADHAVAPPSEEHRGQLLRAMASDAVRGAMERHFGVRLAFQNCHRVAAFGPYAPAEALHADFVSPRAQLLNQSPALRDC